MNADKPIKYELMEKIEDFLEHKWSTDCNLSISTDEDFALLNQLQYEVQVRIYSTYLFRKFLKLHKSFLVFPKEYDGIDHSYYNINDDIYQKFIV